MQGANVRHRALEIVALVNDPVKLQEEREKASINKTKYIGVSGEALRTGGFGGGNSGSAFYGASSTMTSRSRGLSESTSIGNYSHQPSWQHEPSSKANERRSPSISPRQRIEESSQITDSTSDAVAATRARIQKLKLEKQSSPLAESGAPFTAQPTDKKKLTLGDVHVNPKIAASLGLKPVTKTLYKDAKDNNSVMNESIKPGDGGEVDLLGLEQEQKQKQDDAPSNFADWNAFDQQPSLPDTSQAHKQAADSLLADKKQGESGQAEQSGVTRDPFDDLTTARSVTARSRATALPEDMFSSTSTTPQGSQSVASVAKTREQTSRDQDLFADLLT